jgi:Iap family predicted aminopeptidase
MSKSFTELTVNEMKRVLSHLPDPVEHYRNFGNMAYEVPEPWSPSVSMVYAEKPSRMEFSIYSFRVVNYEWVML